jgi:predicted acylesterase/phospholipase RssA
MLIDTLVLSGGGPSGIAYTGIYQALLDNKIIDKELTGIKEIITTSIGILFSFCLIIGLENRVVYEVVKGFDVGSMVQIDNLCIDDFLVDFGLFPTTGIRQIFQSLVKNVLKREDISLRELYEFKAIKLSVKVFNTTKKQIEYISYENYPDLSVIILAEMTTAIPIFFKPVQYNDNLYIDGGLRGSFPIEHCTSEDYLGIFIDGCTTNFFQDSVIGHLFPIIEYMYSLLVEQDQIVYDLKRGEIDPRIICSKVRLGLNFEIDEDTKDKIIRKGYEDTLEYIREHELVNGNVR